MIGAREPAHVQATSADLMMLFKQRSRTSRHYSLSPESTGMHALVRDPRSSPLFWLFVIILHRPPDGIGIKKN